MDWSLAILQTIIIAGVSSWITLIVARRQKNIDLEYDYKKYILEKRKEAYTAIEETINQLRSIDKSYQGKDVSESNRILRTIMQSSKSLVWASPKLATELNGLRHFFVEVALFGLNEYQEGKELSREEHKEFWDTFIKHHTKFEERISKIESTYFDDIIQLNDVNKFISERSKWTSLDLNKFDAP